MRRIISEGRTTYHGTCHECGARFTYEREDVNHNYVRGGDWVSCPSCGHACRHFGASGSVWPRGSGGCVWSGARP